MSNLSDWRQRLTCVFVQTRSPLGISTVRFNTNEAHIHYNCLGESRLTEPPRETSKHSPLSFIMAVLSSPLQYISSTPPATRSFAALLILISGAYFWLQWHQPEAALVSSHPLAPYLVLIPGLSWIYPWTFLTSSFVERSVIEVCFFKSFHH